MTESMHWIAIVGADLRVCPNRAHTLARPYTEI